MSLRDSASIVSHGISLSSTDSYKEVDVKTEQMWKVIIRYIIFVF